MVTHIEEPEFEALHALHCLAGSGQPCTCRVQFRLSLPELLDLLAPEPVEIEQNAEAS